MRVVALLVVLCGCRVGAVAPPDAAPVLGDGLPERVITDAGLWADVRVVDAGVDLAPADGHHADRDGVGEGGDGQGDAGADGAPCVLLAAACPAREACYPFPFEGTPSGETRCGFQGAGSASIPCQSQLECDATALCSAPGQPDSVCLLRCDRAEPRCPAGTACVAFRSYAGVGVCL